LTRAGDETATPRYNNAILADMFFTHHLKVRGWLRLWVEISRLIFLIVVAGL
jgi:hypothetical protein